MSGDFNRAIELDEDDPAYVTALARHALGRSDEAVDLCRLAHERSPANEQLKLPVHAIRSFLEGHTEQGRATIARLQSFTAFSDPEGLYYWAHPAAGLGEHDDALSLLSRAVDTGFYCVRGFEVSPLLSGLRRFPAFDNILDRARVRQRVAATAFGDADGPRLLGLQSTRTEFTRKLRAPGRAEGGAPRALRENPSRQNCAIKHQPCSAAWPPSTRAPP